VSVNLSSYSVNVSCSEGKLFVLKIFLVSFSFYGASKIIKPMSSSLRKISFIYILSLAEMNTLTLLENKTFFTDHDLHNESDVQYTSTFWFLKMFVFLNLTYCVNSYQITNNLWCVHLQTRYHHLAVSKRASEQEGQQLLPPPQTLVQ
jgi:hypothetical protein